MAMEIVPTTEGPWRVTGTVHRNRKNLFNLAPRVECHIATIISGSESKVERFEDPESTSYDRYSPRVHKHAKALISEWCDAVIFATRKIRTQSEDAGFNRKRTIAHAVGKDGGERILRCVGGPSCVAKNRYGITEELPLSWAAFIEALSSNQQQGAKNNG